MRAGARRAASLQTRRLAVLAFAEELAADAELLAAWNAAFDADADATLVILAEGDAEEATNGVLAALERAGIDADAAPDMLLLAAAPFELPPGRRRAGGLHPPGAARRAARPAPRRRPERARAGRLIRSTR